MAAVKWVTHIEAIAERFRGFYQSQRYMMQSAADRGDASSDQETSPLTCMAVRSLIAQPTAGAQLPIGTHVVRGFAWSGAASIVRVEVSVDSGYSWDLAELTSKAIPYAWRRWEYVWRASDSGPVCLKSRATDAQGHVQPEAPRWNRLGYANTAIQTVQIVVV